MALLQQTHYSRSATGGLIWLKTSLGSFSPATSVKYEKLGKFSFPPQFNSPRLSSPKYIWTPCTCRLHQDTNTSRKVCSLIYWPEWCMLQKENGQSLGNWILRDIIYRWGLLLEIVTDNGAPFIKALAYLE